MKNQPALSSLLLSALLVLASGCGKSDSATPSSKQPDQAASGPNAAATPTPDKPAAPVTNPPIAVAETPKPAPDSTPAPAAPAVVPVEHPTPAPAALAPPPVAQAPAPPSASSLAGLSQSKVAQGLTDALGKGLQQAIASLGHDGGFLTNLAVKIPMPEKMQKVETALRAMKQDKLADDFVATMNHAAEQAVPEAGSVFADALKQMTVDDAKAVLGGTNDAATQYFQKTTQTNLYARFYPIVQKATAQTGVTAAYKNVMEKANATQSLGAFGNALGGALLGKDSVDIDAYVTNKAMDGLFKMVAEEEARIRQNPAARTTAVLQQVFGALNR